MHADLRGFEYPLEPVRRQRQWRLDRLLTELGGVQRAVTQAQAELEQLRAQYREHAQAAADAVQQRFDVDAYRRGLRWLAVLRSQVLEQETVAQALVAKRREMQRAFLVQQQKLDVVEAHREDSIADYVETQSSRLLAQADQDWIAKQGLLATRMDV